jgi:hypothetical protein
MCDHQGSQLGKSWWVYTPLPLMGCDEIEDSIFRFPAVSDVECRPLPSGGEMVTSCTVLRIRHLTTAPFARHAPEGGSRRRDD